MQSKVIATSVVLFGLLAASAFGVFIGGAAPKAGTDLHGTPIVFQPQRTSGSTLSRLDRLGATEDMHAAASASLSSSNQGRSERVMIDGLDLRGFAQGRLPSAEMRALRQDCSVIHRPRLARARSADRDL